MVAAVSPAPLVLRIAAARR